MPVETGLKCPALTGTRQSGLTREYRDGPLHTDDTRTPGLTRLLIAVFLVVVIGANVFP